MRAFSEALFDTLAEGIIYFDLAGNIIRANHTAGRLLGSDRAAAAVAPHTWQFYHPSGRLLNPPEQPIQTVLTTGRSIRDEIVGLQTPNSPVLWLRYNATPIFAKNGEPEGVAWAFFLLDGENAATSKYIRRLGALRVIDLTITSNFDLHVTADIFLDQVIDQLGVEAADLLLVDPATSLYTLLASRGFRQPAAGKIRLLKEKELADTILQRKRILYFSDLKSRPEYGSMTLFAHEQFNLYAGVPLISKGKTLGVMEVFHRSSVAIDQDWLDFFETLAGQISIAIDNIQLYDHLQRAYNELSMAYETTLQGWARALEIRDYETRGHSQRVTDLTLKMGSKMGLKDEQLVHLRRGALLHDIGKMGIPDHILHKPGPLTPEEWAVMRKHPEYAYEMLSSIPYLGSALEIPYLHHERWDGSGYPLGLRGEDIPLAARIFAVVDVWDALLSERPYRPAWSAAKAREYLLAEQGRQFDPMVVSHFIKLLDANP